ncbi:MULTISPECIES: hypothetical protein [unclassified Gilliamella]|uniref:hypothetical protein n=1 Tax=unclassified Gilliamella TaxID=2685620 RepID=UPI00080ED89A|nr:hypothetical protein [Gilliamella apicola]OCG19312.1 hypothetical protein A9G23_09240 [Gilliamella apicola]OCG22395.1 hypothetical protein A9G22_07445 [Gilliamella apicola]
MKYESEWYADEALSKWNEIDELFEEEKQQQKALIEAGLDKLGITQPCLRDFALQQVDKAHEHVADNSLSEYDALLLIIDDYNRQKQSLITLLSDAVAQKSLSRAI